MSLVGHRYAHALLELAKEQNQTDAVVRDVGALQDAWLASDELRSIVKNPVVPKPALRGIVDGLMETVNVSPLVRNTIHLLADRGRLPYLPDVLEAFTEVAEAETGRIRAEVTSAKLMSDDYYARLQETLERATGQQVVLVKNEDPSLIGGVVTRIGDRVFDGSISNRLGELEETLLANGNES